MSLLFTLKGRSSTLLTDFPPPIRLASPNCYGPALLTFHSYNTIPNVEDGTFLIVEGNLNVTGAGTVQLVNNAGAFLSDIGEYELYRHRIEFIRVPGRVSTIRRY